MQLKRIGFISVGDLNFGLFIHFTCICIDGVSFVLINHLFCVGLMGATLNLYENIYADEHFWIDENDHNGHNECPMPRETIVGINFFFR